MLPVKDKYDFETFYKEKEHDWISRARKTVLFREVRKTNNLYNGLAIITVLICLISMLSPVLMKLAFLEGSSSYSDFTLLGASVPYNVIVTLCLASSLVYFKHSRFPKKREKKRLIWMSIVLFVNTLALYVSLTEMSGRQYSVWHRAFLSVWIMIGIAAAMMAIRNVRKRNRTAFAIYSLFLNSFISLNITYASLQFIPTEIVEARYLILQNLLLGILVTLIPNLLRYKKSAESIRNFRSIFGHWSLGAARFLVGSAICSIIITVLLMPLKSYAEILVKFSMIPLSLEVDDTVKMGMGAFLSLGFTILAILLLYHFTREVDPGKIRDNLNRHRLHICTFASLLVNWLFFIRWTGITKMAQVFELIWGFISMTLKSLEVDNTIKMGMGAFLSQGFTILAILLLYHFTREVDPGKKRDNLHRYRTKIFTFVFLFINWWFFTRWTGITKMAQVFELIWGIISFVIFCAICFVLFYLRVYVRKNSIEFILGLSTCILVLTINQVVFFTSQPVGTAYHWSVMLQQDSFLAIMFILLFVFRKLISLHLWDGLSDDQKGVFHELFGINSRHIYPQLYWTNFFKAASYYWVIFPISLIWMAISVLVSVIFNSMVAYEDNWAEIFDNWITSADFVIVFFSSFIASVFTSIYVFQDHQKVLRKFTSRVVLDSMLNKMEDHLIIIGMRSLGRNILRTIFPDIHMHERGYEPDYRNSHETLLLILQNLPSFLKPKDPMKIINSLSRFFRKLLSGYLQLKDPTKFSDRSFRVIIDENFNFYIVSTKVLIIDQDESNFRMLFEKSPDYSVGFFCPWRDFEQGLFIAISGNVVHPTIRHTANFQKAKLVDCTIHNNEIAMALASLRHPPKKIFSQYNSPLYDLITALTHKSSTYLINSESIEGISISQRIIIWFMQYLYKNTKIENNLYSQDVYPNMPNFLFIGEGKVVYSILRAIILSMETIGIEFRQAIEYLNHACTIFTNDKDLLDEYKPFSKSKLFSNSFKQFDASKQESYEKFLYWEFFPVRRHNSDLEHDLARIPVYHNNLYNFENYAELVKLLDETDRYPDLIVFLDKDPYGCSSLLNRAMNVFNIGHESMRKPLPSMIVSANYQDRVYANEQLMKYLMYNQPELELRGFPTPLPLEANITRNSVASNQNASMIRALFTTIEDSRREWIVRKMDILGMMDNDQDSEKDQLEAEITFCLSDKAGSLAMLLATLNHKEYIVSEKLPSLRPSFSFCYSYKERHFQQTFIFTGTAFLTEQQPSNIGEAIEACYINTSDGSLGKFQEALRPVSKYLPKGPELHDPCPNNSAVLTGCTISAFLKHKNIPTRAKGSIHTKPVTASSRTMSDLPERVHINIWGDGNDIPGTFSTALCDLMMWDMTDLPEAAEYNLLPLIEFSTSIPCGNNGRAQKRFYMRLWDKNKYKDIEDRLKEESAASNSEKKRYRGELGMVNRCMEKRKEVEHFGAILGMKIKKGGGLITWANAGSEEIFDLVPTDNWFLYMVKLNQFLNKRYTKDHTYTSRFNRAHSPKGGKPLSNISKDGRYSLFIIIRTVDGGNNGSSEEPMLKCLDHYYLIAADGTNRLTYSFSIEKDLLDEFTNTYLRPSGKVKKNYYRIMNDSAYSDRRFRSSLLKSGHELAIIRNDLLKSYKKDSMDVNNRLFFFDDI